MDIKDLELIRQVAFIFHLLANKMTSYAGDLFLDFKNAIDHFSRGESLIVFCHKTHADLIDRYRDILIEENKPHSFEDCVKLCQSTLGLNYAVEITPDKVIITNYKLSDSSLRDLESRIHDSSFYREKESVRIIDLSNKD